MDTIITSQGPSTVIPSCHGHCSISLCLYLVAGGRCRNSGNIPSPWYILHRMNDRTECSNYGGISLAAHAGKNICYCWTIARRFSECCERVGILPEERSDFRPNRSTANMMMFMIRRPQEVTLKKGIPLYIVLSKRTTPLTKPSFG